MLRAGDSKELLAASRRLSATSVTRKVKIRLHCGASPNRAVPAMRDKEFLRGRFLPAYDRSFGRLPHGAPEPGAFSAERLEQRFSERAATYRRRNREHMSSLQIGVIMAFALTIGAFRIDFSVEPPAESARPTMSSARMPAPPKAKMKRRVVLPSLIRVLVRILQARPWRGG